MTKYIQVSTETILSVLGELAEKSATTREEINAAIARVQEAHKAAFERPTIDPREGEYTLFGWKLKKDAYAAAELDKRSLGDSWHREHRANLCEMETAINRILQEATSAVSMGLTEIPLTREDLYTVDQLDILATIDWSDPEPTGMEPPSMSTTGRNVLKPISFWSIMAFVFAVLIWHAPILLIFPLSVLLVSMAISWSFR